MFYIDLSQNFLDFRLLKSEIRSVQDRIIKLPKCRNLTETVKFLREENERKTREIEDLSKTVSKI